jgi:peptidoglycan/LPS O-acetylase OafA/YrhL
MAIEIKKRIVFLDGLRGVAILLVLLFHAFARWPELVPYGDKYASIQFFQYGWLGVDLFFMISGFVILMTLEKTKTFFEFLYRRWLRLFPAMLIVSILVFVTARWFFPERPAGIPELRDLMPGLTFMEEGIWQKIFNSPQGLLEGAFWSLFVEVKFYLIFGIMFFTLGVNRAILGLVCLFLLYIVHTPFVWRFSAEYMGWFAAGALFYQYFKSSERKWLLMGLLTALVSAFFMPKGFDAKFAAALMAIFFTVVIMNERAQAVVGSRFLLFLGFISYPLYRGSREYDGSVDSKDWEMDALDAGIAVANYSNGPCCRDWLSCGFLC